MTAPTTPPIDPGALIRSKGYAALLVLAAVIGIVVSVAGWIFLELTVRMQTWVYHDLPTALGFAAPPAWWPLPILGLAGLPIAYAIVRLPGHGGHRPAGGLASGPPTRPRDLAGVMVAAIAGIGLGVVLGPEAPLIALGGGLALLTVDLVRKGAPDQVKLIMAAAGSFAAISTIFGNPVIGAVIIIEAAGLGGPMLPLVLLPGLLAAGIGSVVFLGMGTVTGLSTTAYALAPLDLPPAQALSIAEFAMAAVIAILAAILVRVIVELAWRTEGIVLRRPFVLIPAAGLVVGLLAIVFGQATGQSIDLILFSGQDAMDPLVSLAPTLSVGTVAAILVLKGLAWSVSLGSFRGGPTFPAIFLGLVGGLLAAKLLGLPETSLIAIGMGAMTVAMLRLPLSSVILAMLVTQADLVVAPVIILAVVVAYIATEALGARRGSPATATTPAARRDDRTRPGRHPRLTWPPRLRIAAGCPGCAAARRDDPIASAAAPLRATGGRSTRAARSRRVARSRSHPSVGGPPGVRLEADGEPAATREAEGTKPIGALSIRQVPYPDRLPNGASQRCRPRSGPCHRTARPDARWSAGARCARPSRAATTPIGHRRAIGPTRSRPWRRRTRAGWRS